MLPPQLRPLGKLVLAARRVQLVPDGQVFFLLLPLVGGLPGERCWEGEVEAPYLEEGYCQRRTLETHAHRRGTGAHQVVDGRCADCVDELHHQLDDEDDDEQRRHLGRLKREGGKNRSETLRRRHGSVAVMAYGWSSRSFRRLPWKLRERVESMTELPAHTTRQRGLSLGEEEGLGLAQLKTPIFEYTQSLNPKHPFTSTSFAT